MEVTIESDTLFEAYDAAQTEESKQAIRDAIASGREVGALDFASLYPNAVESIDADEIVAELEEDDEPMDLDEACVWLDKANRDIEPFGGFVKAYDDVKGDIFISTHYDPERFETPDGWTAIEEEYNGVGFVQDEEYTVEEAADDFVEEKFGDEEETIIVAGHSTHAAKSCINQLPDCNHSQVDGTHYVWAADGTEAADTLEQCRLTQPAEERGLTREKLEYNTVPRTAEEAVEAIQESHHNGAAHITGTGNQDRQPYTISDDEHIPSGWERDPYDGNDAYLRLK